MSTDSDSRCTCHNTLVVKNLNRWFKEKWVDVSRKDKDGKHPPCGRGKAKLSGKGYPKCRPSVKVSGETPKTSGSMSSGQKRAATKRKRAKKQGIGGKPTIVKAKREISDPAYWRRFENPGPLVTPRIPEKKKVKRTFNDSGLSEEDKAKYALERREDEAKRSEEKARVLQENQESRQRYQDRISEMQRSYQEEQRRKQAEEQRMKEAQAVGEVGQDDPESMYENLDWDRMQTGEPMDIAFQLLKRELSPEARRHKLEYDKKYESSPERVKYREELNQERRRRGIYGSDNHKDVSHTQGGRLTLEGEHSNRARHFKNRGTLRVV
jgi:hypothetical protein